MEIEVQTIPDLTVGFLRHMGPYHEVGDTWRSLMEWVGSKGLLGRAKCFGVCHDDPQTTPAAELRYDACVDLTGLDVEVDGELKTQTLPGGRFAKTVHRGTYENLGETYDRFLGRELNAQGYQPKLGGTREVYVNSCHDTPPEDLITDVLAPIH